MLCKLSFKNIKKSLKDYAIYFLTLVLGISIFYLFNCNIMVLFLETNRNLSSYCWHFPRNCPSNWRRTFYKRRMCRSVSWYHRRVDF